MKRRLHSTEPDEADLEALRELYGALGPGLPPELVRVFSGDGSPESEQWHARLRRGRGLLLMPPRRRCLASSDLTPERLFQLPPGWELTRTALARLGGKLSGRGDLLSAQGTYYCRPRGSWSTDALPFVHLWTMWAGRALRFASYLDGFELRRAGPLEGCPVRY
jgi:hypothetical protein